MNKKQKWTSDSSLLLTRTLTAAVLGLAVMMLFCIPVITEWYDVLSGQDPIRTELNIVLYLSDFLGITAVWELFQMLGNIAKGEVFVEKNTRCFRIISWCCFAVSLIWLVLTYWRLLAFFVAFAAAFAGLILRVMKNLLAAATELREESDYTI